MSTSPPTTDREDAGPDLGLGADGEQARAAAGHLQRFVATPYTAERLLRALREVIDGR